MDVAFAVVYVLSMKLVGLLHFVNCFSPRKFSGDSVRFVYAIDVCHNIVGTEKWAG